MPLSKALTNNRIDVLDYGYVILQDKMGSDLTVANSARVSFDKKSEKLTDKDIRLISFLANNDHTSPFRHAILQFEIFAPLMVARQWQKYRVGSCTLEPSQFDTMEAWNESSRRYVTEEPTFYIPKSNEWRSPPKNKKQGSGEFIEEERGAYWTRAMENYFDAGQELFEKCCEEVATEQARGFLPAYNLYIRWYWTTSLQSVCHFLNQRLAHDSQKEIQEYAKAIAKLVCVEFPESYKYLVNTDQ